MEFLIPCQKKIWQVVKRNYQAFLYPQKTN